jgi:DNA polymerase eta
VTVDLIASFGNKLWKELVGLDSKDNAMKISSVQLSFTGLETAETGQKTIEGFLKAATKRTRESEDGTVDENESEANITEHHDDISNHLTTFVCSRCHKRITIPGCQKGTQATQLAAVRLEHDDFHFAQDLAKESDQKVQPSKKKRKESESKGIAKFFKK